MAESQPEERNEIRKRALTAIFLAACVFFFGYFVFPLPVPDLPTAMDRLVYTLQWQTFSVIMFLVGVQAVASKRFRSTAVDPINGRGEHHVAVDSKYLQNTLEQLTLSSFGQLMLSTYLSGAQMRVVPILVFLFVAGRITFWIGYKKSYLHRAFGFSLTFAPTISVYLILMYFIFTSGPIGFMLGIHQRT